MSLAEYLVSLWQKPNRTPEEQRLVEFRKPHPGEDIAAWMMAAFTEKSVPTSRPIPPCTRCVKMAEESPNFPELQTPRPAASWVSQGRVYYAALCGPCSDWEREQRERLQREQENRR